VISKLRYPGIDTFGIRFSETVEFERHFFQFGADPSNGFDNPSMMIIQVFPMYDSLMVKDAISQLPDSFQAGFKKFSIVL